MKTFFTSIFTTRLVAIVFMIGSIASLTACTDESNPTPVKPSQNTTTPVKANPAHGSATQARVAF